MTPKTRKCLFGEPIYLNIHELVRSDPEDGKTEERYFDMKILEDFLGGEKTAHLPVSGTGLSGNER